MPTELAFLLDMHNTLLDNRRTTGDLQAETERWIGPECGQRFRELYEEVRREIDSVDFPSRWVPGWASNDQEGEPDGVLACAGDIRHSRPSPRSR